MSDSVLSGGRPDAAPATFAGWLVLTWFPVVVMLAAIAIESTHLFSSNHTSGWLRSIAEWISGPMADARWNEIHHLIRKTGHFTGYGLLGLAWLRAWLTFWLQPMRFRGVGLWRGCAVTMAVSCTMLVASLDELHQSFMADRTGLATDVLLDTSGAVAMMAACAVLWWIRAERHR